ncbi:MULTISPECIES: urease accessory protein UreE [Enterobacteriaceae]|uniref:Urease accessory protein UreE n=1 Tax=Raoultella lignicola TaxID=3040939 RepID=A0ABU9FBF1_9ENTR|nr:MULTISPECIES: urease accessory protein UreE [Enterobacteriaceae]MRT49338.1 urease accessory protein UreE [Raoultella sp. RIT712]QNK07372.1 urease accessory protein UreE [Enterobacter sp. JUb54]
MLYLTQRVDSPAAALTASVTLPIDVRVKSRIKVTLNDGREAGLLLPRGLLLRGGDVLSNEEGSEFIEVIAANEGVSVVRCDDPFMLAKACYHLGNRHVPLQIMPGELRFHHDHVLDDMLRQFGLAVSFAQLPFEPEAGAYASESHGHHHGHSHGHDHEHHHHEHNH